MSNQGIAPLNFNLANKDASITRLSYAKHWTCTGAHEILRTIVYLTSGNKIYTTMWIDEKKQKSIQNSLIQICTLKMSDTNHKKMNS